LSNVQPFPTELFEIWFAFLYLSPASLRMPGEEDHAGQPVLIAYTRSER
jgi:hypothetical protein